MHKCRTHRICMYRAISQHHDKSFLPLRKAATLLSIVIARNPACVDKVRAREISRTLIVVKV